MYVVVKKVKKWKNENDVHSKKYIVWEKYYF